MRFSPVPSESKNKINKAGKILKDLSSTQEDLAGAREIASRWRACHAYPINTFQSTLRRKIKKYSGETIVAQRLKRMPTIIDKLKRYPAMQLTTMQDIGGVRAVLESVDDVYKLVADYKDTVRFAHELIREDDYIQEPRSADGYRSIHLIYKYKNKQNIEYDGLRLELQIRTKLQHIWATAVETMGTFLGQALKSRQGDQEWLDFFAIVSSAFAIREKKPKLPRFNNLTKQETYQLVATAESKIGALEKMAGFSVAVQALTEKPRKGWAYHLIVLNSLERVVRLIPFDRESFSEANKLYSEYEIRAAEGEKIEPVLVSAGPLGNLRSAYPNFFLDISDFVRNVEEIVA